MAPEERQARRAPAIAAPVARRRPTTEVVDLRSRAGLRRAMLLKEILEPPLALRDPNRGDRGA